MALAPCETRRIEVLRDLDATDGEVGRACIDAERHPALIQVEESVLDLTFPLDTAKPTPAVENVDELRTLKLGAAWA